MTDRERLLTVLNVRFDDRVEVIDWADEWRGVNPSFYKIKFNNIESGIGVVFGNVCYYRSEHRFFAGRSPSREIVELVDRHIEEFHGAVLSTASGRYRRMQMIFSMDNK